MARCQPKESGRLTFRLIDVNGVESEKAWSAPVTLTHDLSPTITINQPSQDTFVVEGFKVPIQIQASDDYGLRKMRYHQALNGEFAAPEEIPISQEKPELHHSFERKLDLADLGAKPGDTISFFASAQDNYPHEIHLAKSETISLHVISEEDYNTYLRQRHDMNDTANKYTELFKRYRDLVEEQEKLAEDAKNATPEELEELVGRQIELNQRFNKFASQLESFVRDNPMYDVEQEFEESLQASAERIRHATKSNQIDLGQMGGETSERASLDDFQQAAQDQLERLGAKQSQEEQEQIAKALEDAALMQEMVKSLNMIQRLYKEQEDIAQQASAYQDRELDQDDRADLQELANRQRQVGEMLEQAKKKLERDADAAEEKFPKACESCRQLADSIGSMNLPGMANQASMSMRLGRGEAGANQSERLRQEMSTLFSECGSCAGQAGSEFDQFMRLTHGMQPGQTFDQMMQSQKFPMPGGRPSMGMGGGGMGLAGSMSNGTQDGPQMGLMGGESMASQMNSGNSVGSETSLSDGPDSGSVAKAVVVKSDALDGMEVQNRR